MTIKDKGEFNKDLDKYIHRRRGPKGLSFGIVIKRKKSVREPEARELTEKKPVTTIFSKRRVEEKSMDDPEKYQELEEELEHVEHSKLPPLEKEAKKEGAVKRFFKFLGGGERPAEEIEEEIPESTVDDDVKDVLKLSLKWIEQLPPAKLREFKSSPDFEKYKSVLLKHGIAKKVEKK